jgi:hypothetical protein
MLVTPHLADVLVESVQKRETAWMTANGSDTPSRGLMEDRSGPRFATLVLAASLALSGMAQAQAQPQQEPPASVPTATDGGVFRLPLIHIPETSGTTDVGTRLRTIPPSSDQADSLATSLAARVSAW